MSVFELSDNLIEKLPDWTDAQKLSHEKATVGFYLSGHPLTLWEPFQIQWIRPELQKLRQQESEKKEYYLLGLVQEMREQTTKKGQKMAFVEFETTSKKCELIIFPEAYQKHSELLQEASKNATVLLICAELSQNEDKTVSNQPKLLVNDLFDAEKTFNQLIKSVQIFLELEGLQSQQLKDLRRHILQNRGRTPVEIIFDTPTLQGQMPLPTTLSFEANPKNLQQINKIFGRQSWLLTMDSIPKEVRKKQYYPRSPQQANWH